MVAVVVVVVAVVVVARLAWGECAVCRGTLVEVAVTWVHRWGMARWGEMSVFGTAVLAAIAAAALTRWHR